MTTPARTTGPTRPSAGNTPAVPWPEVVKFLRQLSHDLRNHLNAFELQAAFVAELVDDPEAKSEVVRLRSMGAKLGIDLQKLSGLISQVRLDVMPYKASELMEDLRAKFEETMPEKASEVEWRIEAGSETLKIDPNHLLEALLEIFENAFLHGRGEGKLIALARVRDRRFFFELREPKKQFDRSTENWGAAPLSRISHAHYGLGLYRVRTILEAHHGQLSASYDSSASVLVITAELPVLSDGTE
jgi:K+-sensing histidine kinase KdpD